MHPPEACEIELGGRGLHGGHACTVKLKLVPGPVRFVTSTGSVPISELAIVRTDRGVKIAAPQIGLELDLVEHLLAAFGALRVHAGVAIEPSGTEVPLLGGGALEFVEALRALEVPAAPPRLRVAHEHTFEHGASRYTFVPGVGRCLDVRVDFPGVGEQSARWNGSVDDFQREFAWARTFGYVHDVEALRAAGRAAFPDPSAVLILDSSGSAVAGCRAAAPAEFAKHKLVDLVGDLYLHGGPPEGRISAIRPGHTATHAVVSRAVRSGVLEPTSNATLSPS